MRVRKSVSQTYFAATATVLMCGLLVMGLLQMGMSMHYFTEERRTALTSVLDIAEAQAHNFADKGIDPHELENSKLLAEQLDLINVTTQAVIIIADEKGSLVNSVGGQGRVTGDHLPAEMLEAMDMGEDVFHHGELGGMLNSKYYVLGRRMDFNGVHAYILTGSQASAMNDYVGDMFSTFILSAGLMLMVSSVLSILMTARITQPLHSIGRAARKFGGGDFSARVKVGGDDEIASLAQTFNIMATNLESIDKSRSQFMGNIAHELRTPMTSIKGFVDAMLDGTIPPEFQQHYLEIVSQETGRLARLVQNMLDITKLEAGEYKVHAQSYDVWETITGVVLANEQRITEGKVEIAGLAPLHTVVYADPDLVHQVMYNLMDNALKFTPEGGTITFDVKRILNTGMVEVSITNTGVGISPEALPFVFERFYKEDASRGLNAKGSGLGLHICKVLINLSGGTIHVDSVQGEWCRFSFTLPEQEPRKTAARGRLGSVRLPETGPGDKGKPEE